MFIVTIFFSNFILSSFNFYHSIIESEPLPIEVISIRSIWCVYHITCLLIVSMSGSRVSNEVVFASTSINKLFLPLYSIFFKYCCIVYMQGKSTGALVHKIMNRCENPSTFLNLKVRKRARSSTAHKPQENND